MLDQYQIDIIMWPRDGAFAQALKHLPGWKLLRKDKVAETFIRT